ncbi:MAG: hypothetical protein ACRCVG_03500 [Methanobacteriaceae archaeon]
MIWVFLVPVYIPFTKLMVSLPLPILSFIPSELELSISTGFAAEE